MAVERGLVRSVRVYPNYRERDKVLRVLLHTPGRWLHGADADWVILDRPQMNRYATALSHIVDRANALLPHAPGRPEHPLRFTLRSEP